METDFGGGCVPGLWGWIMMDYGVGLWRWIVIVDCGGGLWRRGVETL